MMLVQDEEAEEARTLVELRKPHPGLHGLLKKAGEEEGDSLLGGGSGEEEEEEEEEKAEEDDSAL